MSRSAARFACFATFAAGALMSPPVANAAPTHPAPEGTRRSKRRVDAQESGENNASGSPLPATHPRRARSGVAGHAAVPQTDAVDDFDPDIFLGTVQPVTLSARC